MAERLTTLDASYLYLEDAGAPMHVSGVLVLEPVEGGLDALADLVEARLPLVPRYRQRVVFPPFAVAHPTWEDDPDFDIRNHIEELTLPPPADDRVLSHEEEGGSPLRWRRVPRGR